MTKTRDTFKLGVTVIVMFVLFFASVLFIGGGELFKAAEREVTVRFYPGSSMPEISEGSFVVYFGQKVGKVVGVEIVEDTHPDNPELELQFLEITASLSKDVDLRRDCKILATGPPLGGVGQLDIISRGIDEQLIGEKTPVYGHVSGFQAVLEEVSAELDSDNPLGVLSMIKTQLDQADQESLITKIHASITDINAMTATLARELDREQADVLLTKVHHSLDNLHRGLAEVVQLLDHNRPRIDSTIASVDSAAGSLDKDIMRVLAREFEMDDTPDQSLLTKVHVAFDRLNQSLSDVNVMTTDSKHVVALNKDRLGEIIENASLASSHLKQGIKDLKVHPWKILFPPSAAERKELHLFNVAREYAEAAARLDDATTRLRALMELHAGPIPANNPDLVEIYANLTTTVNRFNKAEQALWSEISVE